MTTQALENRLREKIVTESPRPGFETRIQTIAREPRSQEKKSFIRRFAAPAMAVLAIFVIIAPKDNPASQTIAIANEVPELTEEAVAVSSKVVSVQHEIQGLKNDAQRTMSLFKKALPSIPTRKKQAQK